jgi:hypothetical protein
LFFDSAGEVIRLHRPYAYQETRAHQLKEVDSTFVISGQDVGINVGPYDHDTPLIIDPYLSFSTYFGGNGQDNLRAIAVDPSGNVYVAGDTQSTNFPGAPANFQGGCYVSKLSASGTALLYTAVLPNSCTGIAVDQLGDAYVAGWAGRTVTKLDPTGSTILFSKSLGAGAVVAAVALDGAGNAFATGFTTSSDLPVTPNAYQSAIGLFCNDGLNQNKCPNAFLVELSPAGTVMYGSYFGGATQRRGTGVAVAPTGSAWITGAGDFSFVASFDTAASGTSSLLFSQDLAGAASTSALAIATDGNGNAFVTGNTTEATYPTTVGAFQTTSPAGDISGFLSELSPTGSLLYSTFLGNTPNIGGGAPGPNGIAVYQDGTVYVAGRYLPGPTSSPSALLVKVDPHLSGNNALVYSFPYSNVFSFSSSNIVADATCVVLDPQGTAFVGGFATDKAFPIVVPSFQGAEGDGPSYANGDGFVFKLAPSSGPALAAGPGALNFGLQPVGTSSSTQNISITDMGDQSLTLGQISISGDFTQTNNCGSSLAPATGTTSSPSCTIVVTFTPSTPVAKTGLITIADNAPGSPHAIPLSGTGTAATVSYSPSSLTFGVRPVGTTSPIQNITLSSTGTLPLTISNIRTTGSFAQTNGCLSTMAPNTNCTIAVTFAPTTGGITQGSVQISDNAVNSPQTLTLTGTGDGPGVSLSPASVSFGSVPVGTTAGGNTNSTHITLSNSGTMTLSISSVTTSLSDFTLQNGCGSTLAAGAACGISVFFTPQAVGERNGMLLIADNAGGSPQTLALTGTGTSLSIAAASGGSTSSTVTAGHTATYNLQISGANGSVSFSCTGAPAAATCSVSPSSMMVSAGTAAPFTVIVSTTAHGFIPQVSHRDPVRWRIVELSIILLLFILLVMTRGAFRSRFKPKFALLPGFAMLLFLASCGGGGGGNAGVTGTPAGTYILVVTATGQGPTSSTVSLTLTVQ